MQTSSTLEFLKARADAGDAQAATAVGEMLFDAAGRGEAGKGPLALSYFKQAAEAGCPVGANYLSVLLATGVAGQRDLKGAYLWASLAAKVLKGARENQQRIRAWIDDVAAAEVDRALAGFSPDRNVAAES